MPGARKHIPGLLWWPDPSKKLIKVTGKVSRLSENRYSSGGSGGGGGGGGSGGFEIVVVVVIMALLASITVVVVVVVRTITL